MQRVLGQELRSEIFNSFLRRYGHPVPGQYDVPFLEVLRLIAHVLVGVALCSKVIHTYACVGETLSFGMFDLLRKLARLLVNYLQILTFVEPRYLATVPHVSMCILFCL